MLLCLYLRLHYAELQIFLFLKLKFPLDVLSFILHWIVRHFNFILSIIKLDFDIHYVRLLLKNFLSAANGRQTEYIIT